MVTPPRSTMRALPETASDAEAAAVAGVVVAAGAVAVAADVAVEVLVGARAAMSLLLRPRAPLKPILSSPRQTALCTLIAAHTGHTYTRVCMNTLDCSFLCACLHDAWKKQRKKKKQTTERAPPRRRREEKRREETTFWLFLMSQPSILISKIVFNFT